MAMTELSKEKSPSYDIPSFAMDALSSIKAKRSERRKIEFENQNQNENENDKSQRTPSMSLHLRSTANLFGTPMFDTFETTFADINDSEDEFLDDDEVDDDDYEYNTDEDWQSDDDDNVKEKEKEKVTPEMITEDIMPETRAVSRSVTFAPTSSKPKKVYIKTLPSPKNISNKAKSYGAALKVTEYKHFKIRSVTIYGDLFGLKRRPTIKKGKGNAYLHIDEDKEDDDGDDEDEKQEDEDNSKSQTDCEAKRHLIQQEIIETEKSYIKGLRCLLDEFIKPIFEEKMIPRKYEKAVTSIIPTIINFHIQFLDELEVEFNKKEEGNMSNVFIKCAAFLKMYIDYIREYQNILDIFAKHNKSKKLKKHLKTKRKERKPLTNHLILPIQRIPRYMLLLQDLKNKTPETHKHYDALGEALEIVTNVANSVNERKREIENMSQCLQVMENLRELNRNIVEPHRKFLAQFIFRKKDNQRPRQFFVFSDLIIICNLKMKVKMILDMRTIELKRQNSNPMLIGGGMIENIQSGNDNEKEKENENQFRLYTAKGKPIEYETDSDKIDDVLELNELIIKSRLAVWDGDLSRLTNDGTSETRTALKKSGNVSQAQQYRNQLENIQRLRQKKDESTLKIFRKSNIIKGKKDKVLEMLGQ